MNEENYDNIPEDELLVMQKVGRERMASGKATAAEAKELYKINKALRAIGGVKAGGYLDWPPPQP